MKTIASTWIGWYVIICVLLLFTVPVISHSNSWSGVPFAFITMLVGAYQLSAAGARPGTCFVYGCGATVLFLPRFFCMNRFGLWLQHVAPSIEVIVFLWIVLSLVLGAICAGIGMFRSVPAAESSDVDTST